jgi:hypothetical protein
LQGHMPSIDQRLLTSCPRGGRLILDERTGLIVSGDHLRQVDKAVNGHALVRMSIVDGSFRQPTRELPPWCGRNHTVANAISADLQANAATPSARSLRAKIFRKDSDAEHSYVDALIAALS